MHTPESKSFFQLLYANLGALLLAGGLRGLAWWPLLIWLSLSGPGPSVSTLYGLKSLGFLVLAIILDPYLAGGALALARDLARGGPGGLSPIRLGLGRRYGALLAWTLIQAAAAGLLLFNLAQVFRPTVGLPTFMAYLAGALALWVWLLVRAMHLHLPGLLGEGLSLGPALRRSQQAVFSRPGRHLYLLVFRFGVLLLLMASGVGAMLGWGSFLALHAETVMRDE